MMSSFLVFWSILVGTTMVESDLDLYGIPLVGIEGQTTTLEPYRDKVILVVNTASECGFTRQYKGLEQLWKDYGDQGFVVLGFPCNQFGGQEPGTEADIMAFCEKNFGVSFPLFAKVDVNGKKTHPLFQELKQRAPGFMGTEGIKWNFTKFLIKPGGEKIKRYGSRDEPEELVDQIKAWLPKT